MFANFKGYVLRIMKYGTSGYTLEILQYRTSGKIGNRFESRTGYQYYMKLGITWRQELGIEGSPYLIRWVLNLGFCSIRLHNWLDSDDLRHKHDHAWWFITYVIKGHYVNIDCIDNEDMKKGSWALRGAEHRHCVKVLEPTWTIMLTGPATRKWGFWVNGKFKKANKYFFEQGHHTRDGSPAIRTVKK